MISLLKLEVLLKVLFTEIGDMECEQSFLGIFIFIVVILVNYYRATLSTMIVDWKSS